jgi:hypothetical protein
LDREAQAKALRLYVLCSECARLIDLVEGNPPKPEVEGAATLLRSTRRGWKCSASAHKAEEARRRGTPTGLGGCRTRWENTLDNLTRTTAPHFRPPRSTQCVKFHNFVMNLALRDPAYGGYLFNRRGSDDGRVRLSGPLVLFTFYV